MMLGLIYLIGGLLGGVVLGYLIRFFQAKQQLVSAESTAQRIISEAKALAEAKRKDGILEVKEIMDRERTEFEKRTRERREEMQNAEKRLHQREENIDRKLDLLEKRERETAIRERNSILQEKTLRDDSERIGKEREELKKILERVAGMTADEAKKMLIQNIEQEARHEAALKVKKILEEAKETADGKAKEILSVAIQRVAAEHTTEITVSTVPLPSDEIKGRIIGREGRNIRAFEQATGVDLIVDDTPEAITISAFDGSRREVARIALERLIADGRIHPSRIEEIVTKVKNEMEENLKATGERTALELGISGLPAEILRLLGKLKYRTSYGQSQLQHTIEVALIAGSLAGELGADVTFCKRAGLLHDLGKAIDHDVEGTHHQISADLARKYHESEKMINAILSHHEGLAEPKSVEAFVLAAADAISAARPGARRETLEHYLKRIEKLEKIATSFRGVSQAYAIQAGREVRVLVEPEDISDEDIFTVARDIAKKLEEELEYPGQIKVTVIRETRAMEIAK
ncbi:MAG: ribonuclease Y [Elusimicrobiota bacterium]